MHASCRWVKTCLDYNLNTPSLTLRNHCQHYWPLTWVTLSWHLIAEHLIWLFTTHCFKQNGWKGSTSTQGLMDGSESTNWRSYVKASVSQRERSPGNVIRANTLFSDSITFEIYYMQHKHGLFYPEICWSVLKNGIVIMTCASIPVRPRTLLYVSEKTEHLFVEVLPYSFYE